MEFINVLVAAAVGWVYGAIHYMTLSKQWLAASGIECDENGKPKNGGSPLPFLLSALCMILVAGMMRHIFAMSGIVTIGGGAVAGLGIGAFFIAPWVVINNAYGMRPFMLSVIDGGYAVIGCLLMGAVLNSF